MAEQTFDEWLAERKFPISAHLLLENPAQETYVWAALRAAWDARQSEIDRLREFVAAFDTWRARGDGGPSHFVRPEFANFDWEHVCLTREALDG